MACGCKTCAAKAAQQGEIIIETSNPGPIGTVAGSFKSPRTGQTIVAMAKKGESKAHAIARVRARHGA